MEISEAIRLTRIAAEEVRMRAIQREASRLHMLAKEDEETVEAMTFVCDELEAIRKKQKAIDAVYEDAIYLRGEVERLRGELEDQRARRIRQVFEHR